MRGLPSVIQPLVPIGSHWVPVPVPMATSGFPCTAWIGPLDQHRYVQLFSAVEIVRELGQPDVGPEYHVSIACRRTYPYADRGPERIDSSDARAVLAQFGFDGWTEDNHVAGGVVRSFWRPVAEPLVGWVCRCVDEEPAVREEKGDFVWRGVTR
jgi:hypothetical protein